MATLLCFGFGYCAEHFVATFGARIRSHRRHGARRRTRRGLECLRRRTTAGAGVRRQPADAGAEQCDRRGGLCAGLGSPGRGRRSGPCCMRRVFAACEAVARDRLSVDDRRLRRPRRRMGRRDKRRRSRTSARGRERLAAEQAWQELGARHGVARRDPASRRHLRAGTECAGTDRARQSAPHRQARTGFQPHPCRRYRASDRCRIHARARREFSTSPTTSRRRPAIRSSLPRNCWDASRRRKSPSRTPRRRCRRWR